MDSIEITAKKVDDAIREGLKQLDVTLDDVDVSVLDSGGFFRKAKIRLTLTEEAQAKRDKENAASGLGKPSVPPAREPAKNIAESKRSGNSRDARFPAEGGSAKADEKPRGEGGKKGAPLPSARPASGAQAKERPAAAGGPARSAAGESGKSANEIENKALPADEKDQPSQIPAQTQDTVMKFIGDLTRLMGAEVKSSFKAHGRDLDVALESEDGAVIGYRGETLDAIEYLTSLVVNKGDGQYVKVSIDCNNYRLKREESLVRLAEKMAAKCVKTGRKVALEPMNSASRRVIHAALSENDKITTKSEGKEPNRRIVIYCKRGQERA